MMLKYCHECKDITIHRPLVSAGEAISQCMRCKDSFYAEPGKLTDEQVIARLESALDAECGFYINGRFFKTPIL